MRLRRCVRAHRDCSPPRWHRSGSRLPYRGSRRLTARRRRFCRQALPDCHGRSRSRPRLRRWKHRPGRQHRACRSSTRAKARETDPRPRGHRRRRHPPRRWALLRCCLCEHRSCNRRRCHPLLCDRRMPCHRRSGYLNLFVSFSSIHLWPVSDSSWMRYRQVRCWHRVRCRDCQPSPRLPRLRAIRPRVTPDEWALSMISTSVT
mmetsp:Transcript_35867/g.85517  ORF Transcript_35867/g.85517 Transcript_35867/m.85517 type:complete len:204 (+) Transcript_35867:767-1378(+)